MIVITATSRFTLSALEPPEGLAYAYLAGCEIRDAIGNGEMEYTKQGIKEWASTQDRKNKIAALTSLVRGYRLKDLDTCFINIYTEYVSTSPAARASKVVLQEEMKNGATVETIFPILLPVLT